MPRGMAGSIFSVMILFLFLCSCQAPEADSQEPAAESQAPAPDSQAPAADSRGPAAGSQMSQAREAIGSQLPDRPYSQAVRVGNTYYFSGKLGVSPETLTMDSGRIQAETRNVMESFRELFQELGVDFRHVVKGTVYLADVRDYDGMNDVYGEYFPTDPPARECVAAGEILSQGLVEISFVAVVPQ